jgi:hypothetical protein
MLVLITVRSLFVLASLFFLNVDIGAGLTKSRIRQTFGLLPGELSWFSNIEVFDCTTGVFSLFRLFILTLKEV